MVMTQIFVVMCALTGADCVNYVDITRGTLSAAACDRAIEAVARVHMTTGSTLHRERSFCSSYVVNTIEDRDS